MIDLSGKWHFTTDPKNEGEQAGYSKADFDDDAWQRIEAGKPWEYQGVTQDNSYAPFDAPFGGMGDGGNNKPYNGYAWYRTNVYVPDLWKGAAATLQIGDISSCGWVYVNGRKLYDYTPQTPKVPLSPNTPAAAANLSITIPADALKFGQANSIAIRVYNANVAGGITKGPVLLRSDAFKPHGYLETGVGPNLYRQWAWSTGYTTMLASVLSPGAYVLTKPDDLTLSDWELRDFVTPDRLAVKVGDKVFSADASKAGEVYDATRDGKMTACWIMLWNSRPGAKNPRPVMVLVGEPVFKVVVTQPTGGPRSVRIVMFNDKGDVDRIQQFGRYGLICPFGTAPTCRPSWGRRSWRRSASGPRGCGRIRWSTPSCTSPRRPGRT